MKDLTSVLEETREHIRKKAESDAASRHHLEEAVRLTKAMAAEIEQGTGSTGNEMRDALMVGRTLALIPPCESQVEEHRKFDLQLRQSVNQLILFVETAKASSRPGSEHYRQKMLMAVVGGGLQVLPREGKILCPITKVVRWDAGGVSAISLTEFEMARGFLSDLSHLAHVEIEKPENDSHRIFVQYIGDVTVTGPVFRLVVRVENTEVLEWFQSQQMSLTGSSGKYLDIYNQLVREQEKR